MSNVIERARIFASKAHEGQFRKYTGEPYVHRPESVANTVAAINTDETMVAAAWLHDVVEDAPFTIEDIRFEFGAEIAELVDELTDKTTLADGNRRTSQKNGKRLYRQHLQ